MEKTAGPSSYEEILQQDHERFRELAELMPEIVYEFDTQGVLTFINKQSLRITGYSLEDFQEGLHALTLVDPADRARAADSIRRIMQGENLGPSQYKARRKDGSAFIGEARSAAVYRDGKVVGLRGIVVDITERKQANEALRSSEERFKELAELLPEIVFEMDERGMLTFVNRQAYEITGYTREDFDRGLGALDVIAPGDRRRATENITKIMGGQKVGFNEYTLTRKDGSAFPVITRSVPIIRDGRCVGLRGILVDITERKQIEEALRESEANYHAIFDAVNDGIFIHETGTLKIAEVNEKACEMFGYTREELCALDTRDLVKLVNDLAVVQKHLAAAMQGEPQLFECRARNKAGGTFWIEANLKNTAIGGRDRLIAVVRNIEGRKQLEQQVRNAQKMEAVGRLAGGIAHDFNNLLTAIIGYSEVILNNLEQSDPVCEPLTQIRDAGHRAAALTKQLLAFGRKQVLDMKVTDLNSVVESLRDMIETLVGEKISLETALDPQGVLARIDAGQIEHVILNLALNARDAMPEGGTLTVRTFNHRPSDEGAGSAGVRRQGPPADGYVMLSVTDTGHGIDEETRSRIFEPFFSTKEKSKGTGLGLSMVYGIVEQHGGRIDVESAPGRGAAFKICLPRAAEDESPRIPARGPAARTGSNETVLVVEDEDVVRGLTCALLRQCGYEVLQASMPSRAEKICREHDGQIDLVVMDIMLPEMDGHRLFELLTKERPNIKVLYVSGYADDADLSEGGSERRAEFLQKPFTASGLARKVREALDQSA